MIDQYYDEDDCGYERDPPFMPVILSSLIRFAAHNRHLKLDYIHGVEAYFEKNGHITPDQSLILDRIYKEHNVNKFFEIHEGYANNIF